MKIFRVYNIKSFQIVGSGKPEFKRKFYFSVKTFQEA